LKKVLIVLLLLILLFIGFILRFGSALTQEGNPLPYIIAIIKYELSNNGYEVVLETTNETRYISKFEKKYPLGMVKEFMKTRGWEFKEQMGSGLVFEKDKETITIETRQYSKHYFIWDIPKELSAENIKSNVFDAKEVQVGDSIAGQKIHTMDVIPDGHDFYHSVIHFRGNMVLEGEIEFFEVNESNEGWGLGNYFTPDDTSIHLIPILNIDTNRTGFTIEDNQHGELDSFKKNGRKYVVKIEVKNFELYALGKGQENKATLITVLKAEKL